MLLVRSRRRVETEASSDGRAPVPTSGNVKVRDVAQRLVETAETPDASLSAQRLGG